MGDAMRSEGSLLPGLARRQDELPDAPGASAEADLSAASAVTGAAGVATVTTVDMAAAVDAEALTGAGTPAARLTDTEPDSVPDPSFDAFDCKMCGQCCQGEGGIVVGPSDLLRLADHLAVSPDQFAAQYGVRRNGKLFIRAGEDGFCLFFTQGKGCGVHVAKPDICRAWPFFRGNVLDAGSLEFAKEYCPGIRKDVTHAEFARQGRAYLAAHMLVASDPTCEARALILDD